MKQPGRIILFVIIPAIAFIFSGISYAQQSGEDQKRAFCTNYANTALQQVQQRNASGQPASADDPYWANDYEQHFNWCMSITEDDCNTLAQMRSDWLAQNAGQPPVSGQEEKKPGTKREAKEKLTGGTGPQTTAASCSFTYRFDPQNLIIGEFKGGWAVMDGTNPSRAIHSSRQEKKNECEQVLKLLQFYSINEQCFTDANGITFYFASGSPPSGSYSGEQCRQFDPQALTIQQGTVVSSKGKGTPDWEILENGKLFFRLVGSLGQSDEATAMNVVNIIQQNGFTQRCSLGGFTYMRK